MRSGRGQGRDTARRRLPASAGVQYRRLFRARQNSSGAGVNAQLNKDSQRQPADARTVSAGSPAAR